MVSCGCQKTLETDNFPISVSDCSSCFHVFNHARRINEKIVIYFFNEQIQVVVHCDRSKFALNVYLFKAGCRSVSSYIDVTCGENSITSRWEYLTTLFFNFMISIISLHFPRRCIIILCFGLEF